MIGRQVRGVDVVVILAEKPVAATDEIGDTVTVRLLPFGSGNSVF